MSKIVLYKLHSEGIGSGEGVGVCGVWDWVFRCSSTNDQKMKLFRLCGTCVCFSDLSPEFRFEFDLNSLFMSRGTTNGPIDMGQRSWVPLGKPPPEMPLLMEHLMWKGSMLS